MNKILSDKQLEFIVNSNAVINLAHGSVRSGKTVGTLYRFMQAAYLCPDSQIWMIGHTATTIYNNAIRLLLEPSAQKMEDPLAIFRPFCTWNKGDRVLLFHGKKISTVGVANAGAIGIIQGATFSLCYCDEMTLYPETILDMISTRLSLPHSMLFASMNPMHPTHRLKQWIDKGEGGDKRYFNSHFTLDDNPFLEESYKTRIRDSLSGVFYKRNYLGLWCLAEGAIFDFFDRKYYVYPKRHPPACAQYWIMGVDYGTSNAFAAVIIGVSTGQATQTGKKLWVEKEYFWDSKKQNRQKLNHEYAEDVCKMCEGYAIKNVYIDPSAESFRLELQRRGKHVVLAKNEVLYGIQVMTTEMKQGNLLISDDCPNLIREIESYVWDPEKSDKGKDTPLKKDDHAVDALRYAIATHRVQNFDIDEYNRKNEEYLHGRYYLQGHQFR